MRAFARLSLLLLTLVAVACGADSMAALDTEPNAAPNIQESNRDLSGAVVLLHNWRWADVMSNMGRLRDAGFTALQLSPHSASCAGAYGEGYDPYDYTNFNSGFGSDSDLYWLLGTAHYYGMQVYADMVLNHMCPKSDYGYPRFGWNDFHHNGGISDWNNWENRENCDLFGLNDLAQESGYVRSELYNFVVKSSDLGFDGFRWDAAKHVPLWFWRDHIVNNVNSWGKFNFGEVYSANLDELQQYANAGMAVTDYNLYDAIRNSFQFGGDLAALDGAGFAARNGSQALTFVENHDVGAPPNRLLAYAFLSAYVGYPLYSDSALNDDALKNLVWIHRHKAFGSYLNRYKSHDVFIFERQGNLLAALNQSGDWVNQWVATSWRNTRLNDYTGHTGERYTNNDGWVEVAIPPGGYVMLAP